MARALGLKMLFTPVRSPESNGMSESFVKTLKRDYARLNVLTDADVILAMLPDWIENYCEVHPHSGLKFRSPREFICKLCTKEPGRFTLDPLHQMPGLRI